MNTKKKENKCKKCQRTLPREQFFIDARGYLKERICNDCRPRYRREQYLKRGGWKADVKARKKYYAKNPWAQTYRHIKQRTGSSGRKTNYCAIENKITVEELKFLWFRDNAEEMVVPSIDRINPEGDYTLENCRYLELAENIARRRPQNSFLI